MADKDEYTIYVKFTRYRSEDSEQAEESFPTLTPENALLNQFAAEMQEASNNGMAGEWRIIGSSLNPVDVRAGVAMVEGW